MNAQDRLSAIGIGLPWRGTNVIPNVSSSWDQFARQANLSLYAGIEAAPDIGGGSGFPVNPLHPVWPLQVGIGMNPSKAFAVVMTDFGDAFEQRGLKSQAYTHADGSGGVTSHRGRWEFQIKIPGIEQGNSDPSKEMNEAWQFLTDRLGSYEAFYFYNPVETNGTIDLTGASTVGRYLVRLKDPVATFEAFVMRWHRGQLVFTEVRS